MPGLRDGMKRWRKTIGSAIAFVTGSSLLASETTLASGTIPKNIFSDVGDYVKITCWGRTVNNANAKTIKLYFGSTVMLNLALTVSQVGIWYATAYVLRTGLSTQRYFARLDEQLVTLTAGKAAHATATNLTESEQADILVKVTGTAPTADADMTCEGFMLEPWNITQEIQL